MADGVGGGPAGDLASAALVHRLVAGMRGATAIERLETRIRLANWDLRAHTARDDALHGMSTTLTGVFVDADSDDGLLVAHIGDSRAYRLRDGVLTRMTRDDSYVQELVDRGLVSPLDAVTHPRRNIITASYSGDERDIVRIERHEAHSGDRWMLCSDGVSDYVPDELLRAVLSGHPDAATAAATLVAVAERAGSRDNITAVVADVTEGDCTADSPVFRGAAAARFSEGLGDLEQTA